MPSPRNGTTGSSNAPIERRLPLLPSARPAVSLAGRGLSLPGGLGPGWKCADCDAYIRCYRGTTTSLGTLADADTRHWRSLAHRALDPLWQRGERSRSAVYRDLAAALRILEHQARIALMGPAECRAVIDWASALQRPAK